MKVDEWLTRLRKAGCFVFVHRGTVNLIVRKPEIMEDLRARGARVNRYERNPAGARSLGEELLVEWDVVLRPGLGGVTGAGGEPVTLDELLEAARA